MYMYISTCTYVQYVCLHVYGVVHSTCMCMCVCVCVCGLPDTVRRQAAVGRAIGGEKELTSWV